MALLRVGWHNLWCKEHLLHTSLQGGPGLPMNFPRVDPYAVDFGDGQTFVFVVCVLSTF